MVNMISVAELLKGKVIYHRYMIDGECCGQHTEMDNNKDFGIYWIQECDT